MNIKKQLISLIGSIAVALLACAPVATAQETGQPVTMLMVNLHNGSIEKYLLSDTPVVTFDGDAMVVTSDGASGTYDRPDVSHFEIKKDWYSEAEAVTLTPEVSFSFTYTDNANVTVAAPALTRVDLYTPAGVKVAQATATDGTATISLAALPAGVYLVAPDCHKAIKIIKK